MRYIFVITALMISSLVSGQRSIKSWNDGKNRSENGTKYEYLLGEAIRSKYMGDLRQAVALFEKCIEIDASRSVPYYELAQIYSSAGADSDAKKLACAAARLEPDNFWYQVAAGSLFIKGEENDSAIVYFERALRSKPGSTEIAFMLSGIYTENKQYEKADSLFHMIESEGRMTEEMYLMMISTMMRTGNAGEAAKKTRKLIELNPGELKFRALLADIYSEEGLAEKSDSIYRAIIEENPDDIEGQLLYLINMVNSKQYSGMKNYLSNVYKSEFIEKDRKVAIALTLLQDTVYVKDNQEDVEQSLIILEKAYPEDEEILSLRAGMYEMTGRTDEAIARYEDIISKVKPAYYSKEKLIILYGDRKQYEKLYVLASVYATENNKSLLGKVYYALAAMELKRYDVAETELRKAVILAGNNDQLKMQVLSMMGDLKYRTKDYTAAFDNYEQALAISPHDPLVLNNYAYFLAEGGQDYKRALKMAEEVMKIEPGNPTYVDTYAWVLHKLGKNKDALAEIMSIYSMTDERDPEILEHTGYILKALKRCGEAVPYWKEALEKDSTKEYLKDEIAKCSK